MEGRLAFLGAIRGLKGFIKAYRTTFHASSSSTTDARNWFTSPMVSKMTLTTMISIRITFAHARKIYPFCKGNFVENVLVIKVEVNCECKLEGKSGRFVYFQRAPSMRRIATRSTAFISSSTFLFSSSLSFRIVSAVEDDATAALCFPFAPLVSCE